MKITLENLPKISTNEIYSGVHWRVRVKHKETFLWLTIAFKKLAKIEHKVDIDFTFFFAKNPLDSDNCSYVGKLIVDCLVAHGVLADDKRKFVGRVSYESNKGEKDICEVLLKPRLS